MADGSLLPIEDIEVGDQVLATDPETGVQGPRTVMATIVGDGDKQLVEVTAAGATVTATDGHPFWVIDLDGDQGGVWVDAVDLQPGDLLLASGGQPVAVTAVATYGATATVHNLTVEDTHTYHIAVGGTDTLVHNCGGVATVHLDPVERHALITIRSDAGEVLSTEQFGGPRILKNGVREFDPAALPSSTININAPLPNAKGALAYAEVMMDKTARGTYPRYSLTNQSCVTYCANDTMSYADVLAFGRVMLQRPNSRQLAMSTVGI